MNLSEKRSLLEMIFGPRQPAPAEAQNVSRLQMMSGYNATFTSWGGDPYESEAVRAAVDAIARNAAKLRPRHVRREEGRPVPVADTIQRVLELRPNPNMSGYDFLYKMVSSLMLENNSFAYPVWQGPQLMAIWPVNYQTVEFLEDNTRTIYVKFYFADGGTAMLPYSEVIHLRRHYYKNDMLGSGNEPINTTLAVIQTTNEGLAEAIKTSATLKGILKFDGMLKAADIERHRLNFMNNYMTITNSGGIAALDAKADYVPINNEPKMINALHMKELRDSVFRYFGVNEKIVNSSYNEDEWNAFYESVLEPIAVQLGLEMTRKLFTDREIGFGNEIIFESNRLQYASARTKISMARELLPMGALTINEIREIFNLAPVEDGDKRVQTLNVVSADKADQYQLDLEDKDDEREGDDDGDR